MRRDRYLLRCYNQFGWRNRTFRWLILNAGAVLMLMFVDNPFPETTLA
jgi:hypothetical protein